MLKKKQERLDRSIVTRAVRRGETELKKKKKLPPMNLSMHRSLTGYIVINGLINKRHARRALLHYEDLIDVLNFEKQIRMFIAINLQELSTGKKSKKLPAQPAPAVVKQEEN